MANDVAMTVMRRDLFIPYETRDGVSERFVHEILDHLEQLPVYVRDEMQRLKAVAYIAKTARQVNPALNDYYKGFYSTLDKSFCFAEWAKSRLTGC